MSDLESLLHATPRRIDAESVEISADDKRLIRFGEKLLGEGESWQEELGLEARLERAVRYMENRHFVPGEGKKHHARVVANLIRSIIERKVGMHTDTIPQLDVRSRSGNTKAAELLKKNIIGVWAERSMQEAITRGLIMAAMGGSSACHVAWDRSLDMGFGDIRADILPASQVIVDPFLSRASALQEDAQYVIVKTIRPLTEFVELYKRGHLVKPEAGLSHFSRENKLKSQKSGYIWRKPSRANEGIESSAIPRATEYRLYFRDRTRVKGADGALTYLFPRKRCIIWAGNVPLYDGNSGYWDGLFPVEIFDWGIETRHIYGESEVDILQTLQMAYNILVSGIVDNARLINDPPWIIDEDALDEEDLQYLRRYGDKPGWTFVKKPGTEVRRDPPGHLHPIVFNVLQFLQQGMEMVSGVSEALQGRLPKGVNSGILYDSLQLIGQVPIRMQSRGIEGTISRIGQLLISRIFQYYDDSRLLEATDLLGEGEEVVAQRNEFLQALALLSEWKREEQFHKLFRDLRFIVTPGSSLAVAKLQKLSVMERLNAQQKVPDIEVLKAAEISDPEAMIQEARQEMVQKMQMMAAAKGGGGPTPPKGGQGGVLSKENLEVPAAQQAGAGGRRAPFPPGA